VRCTPRRVKVGLALGGGMVRGISHIGVLRALEQNSVPIHGIVGSSMGAIIGGLYASGYSPDSLESVVQDSIDWVSIFRDQPPRTELPLWERLRDKPKEPGLDLNWSRSGPLPLNVETGAGIRVGQKFTDEIASRTLESDYRAGFDFDNLCVPFGAMLTNMKTRRSELIRKGTVSTALRGSGAFPLAFEPMWIDDTPYIDGGVLDNLPVDAYIPFDSTRAPRNLMRADTTQYHFVIAVYPASMDTSASRTEIPTLSGPLGIVVLQKAFSLAREYHVRNSWAAAHGRICIDATGEFDFGVDKSREVIAKGDSATRRGILEIKRGIARKEDSLRFIESELANMPAPSRRIKELTYLGIESASGESVDTAEIFRAVRFGPRSYIEQIDICEALRRIHDLGVYQSVEVRIEEEDATLALTFCVTEKPRDSLCVVLNMDNMRPHNVAVAGGPEKGLDTTASIVEHAINSGCMIPGFGQTKNTIEKTLVSQGYIGPRVDSVRFASSGPDGKATVGTLYVHGWRGRRIAGASVKLKVAGALGRSLEEATRLALVERFSRQTCPEEILRSATYVQREFQIKSVSVEGAVGDSLIITAHSKSDATLEFPSVTWEPYEGLSTYGELRLRDILVADFAPFLSWTQNYPLKFAEELPRAQRFAFGFERCVSCPRISLSSLLSDVNFRWQKVSCPCEPGTPAYHKALNELALEYRVPFYLGDLAAVPSAEYAALRVEGREHYQSQGAGVFWLRYDRLDRIVFPGSGLKADLDAKLGTEPGSSLDFERPHWRRARARALLVHPIGKTPKGVPLVGNKPVILGMRLYGSMHSVNTPVHECYSLGGLTPPGSYELRLRDHEDLPGYQRDEVVEPIMLKAGCTARICLNEWSVLGLRAGTNLVTSFHFFDAVPEGSSLFPMNRRTKASQYLGLHVDTSLLNAGVGFKAAWPEKMIDLRSHSRDHIHLSIVFYGLAI
jgi:predicted acylesterase/phospholipase RssA